VYMNLRLPLTAVFALLALSFVACGKKEAPPVDTAKEQAAADSAAKEKEMLETAIDAYVYAYPLVTMEYTRRALTNTEKPERTKAPASGLRLARAFLMASVVSDMEDGARIVNPAILAISR